MIRYVGCFAVAAVCGTFEFLPVEPASAATVIVCPKTASFAEKLAAKEIRRYVYLRSGELLPIAAEAEQGCGHDRPENRSGAVGRRVPTENDRCQRQADVDDQRRKPDRRALRGLSLRRETGRAVLSPRRRGPRRKISSFPPRARRAAQAAVCHPRHPALPRLPRRPRLVEPGRLPGLRRATGQAQNEFPRAAHLSGTAARTPSRWSGSGCRRM